MISSLSTNLYKLSILILKFVTCSELKSIRINLYQGTMANEAPDYVSKKLNFCMETQQMDCWCWLAVGTSIALFYDQNSAWTQCQCLDESDPELRGYLL